MSKTFVYVDGFNLYHRALKKTRFKWLDLEALMRVLLPQQEVLKIKYYTARVTGFPWKPGSSQDQFIYWKALDTLPKVERVLGQFRMRETKGNLLTINGNPIAKVLPESILNQAPLIVEIQKPEEKGSDVNLAVDLLHDAHLGNFEEAFVFSGDSDMARAIQRVRDDCGRKVGIISPFTGLNRPETFEKLRELKSVSSKMVLLKDHHLEQSQFPNSISLPDGKVLRKPKSW